MVKADLAHASRHETRSMTPNVRESPEARVAAEPPYPVGHATVQPLLWVGLAALGYLTWMLAALMDDVGWFFRETPLERGGVTLAFALNAFALLLLFDATIRLRGGRDASAPILLAIAWAGIAPLMFGWLLTSDGSLGWMAILPWAASCATVLLVLVNQRTRLLAWSGMTLPRRAARRAWSVVVKWIWVTVTLLALALTGRWMPDSLEGDGPIGILLITDTLEGNVLLGVTALLLMGVWVPAPGTWSPRKALTWVTVAIVIWLMTLIDAFGVGDNVTWLLIAVVLAAAPVLSWLAWKSFVSPIVGSARGRLVWRRGDSEHHP